MTIGEVSKKFNISKDTLRYYEKEGLINQVSKMNNRREYSEHDIENINFILCMRTAGMSIEILKKYIDLCRQGDGTAEERRNLLIEQREVIHSKIKEMEKAYNKLSYKIDFYYQTLLKKEKEFIKGE